ncbi:MAG: hypothetical protein JO108_03715 [Acidobacteriaceae bacterium]|nr:hypothetical protein [Acidobacteriaceae bacterium]
MKTHAHKIVTREHYAPGPSLHKLTPPSPRPPALRSSGGPPPEGRHPDGPTRNDFRPGQPHPRIGERTNEAWADEKVGFYYAVVDAMLQTGFSTR